ncbi:WD40-repeat-containing domain protein [Dichotomocladium elegans]|nr:WD40-repeat-containing domain protein [Dichotomocladium elegans]
MFYIDPFDSPSAISSIEFDCDNEYFAVAGASRDIKIFDFSVIDEMIRRTEYTPGNDSRSGQQSLLCGNVQRVHCPSQVIDSVTRVSCLAWSNNTKSHLASSDHNGLIKIWDTNEGLCVQTFDEHEKRAWSVDICPTKSTLIASGSDNGTVKIWSTTMRQSVFTLQQHSNVCCVRFGPDIDSYLAMGTSDHKVTCYDLRYPDTPVYSFRDHERAVSYVRWLSGTDIISASIDNSLRRWDLISNKSCVTYRGHKNGKHFVGLSTDGNWISCGSEDNHVYAYHKDIKSPIAKFRFPMADDSGATNGRYRAFVSSLCWKSDSSVLVAANSKGIIKVLKLDKE